MADFHLTQEAPGRFEGAGEMRWSEAPEREARARGEGYLKEPVAAES